MGRQENVRKLLSKQPFRRARTWENNIQMDLMEICCEVDGND
jgi:hypothetical protein